MDPDLSFFDDKNIISYFFKKISVHFFRNFFNTDEKRIKLLQSLIKVNKIFKIFHFVVSLKVAGSGSRSVKNIRIRLDPDPPPH